MIEVGVGVGGRGAVVGGVAIGSIAEVSSIGGICGGCLGAVGIDLAQY